MAIVSNQIIKLVFDFGYRNYPEAMKLYDKIAHTNPSYEPEMYSILLTEYLNDLK